MRPAVFVDKDGTLIHDVPYNTDPGRIRLRTGAAKALAALQNAGYALILVSNQAGVALGRFQESDLEQVWIKITACLCAHHVGLSAIYYCPHHPEAVLERYRERCECRKPGAGLLLRAAHERFLDLARSWMVGDILDDVEAGHRAGCRAVLLDVGSETQWQTSGARMPDFIACDLASASRHIIGSRARPPAHPSLIGRPT